MSKIIGVWTAEPPQKKGWYWTIYYTKSETVPNAMEPMLYCANEDTGRRRWSIRIEWPAWPKDKP